MSTTVYRYEDRVYSTVSISVSGYETYGTTPVRVELLEYPILRCTPCGYWIGYGFSERWIKRNGRFAMDTKEGALKDFIRRKSLQSRILKKKLERAQDALRIAIEMRQLAPAQGQPEGRRE